MSRRERRPAERWRRVALEPLGLVVASEGQTDWVIALPDDADPAVAFAAAELQRYLEAISDVRLPMLEVAGAHGVPAVALARDPETAAALLSGCPTIVEPDGFRLRVDSGGALLVGQRPRATLYAAYALLERLGCRWLGPGDEVVPRRATIALPTLEHSEAPAFANREVIEDGTHVQVHQPAYRQQEIEDDARLIDWMAKVRLSGFFPFRYDPEDPGLDDAYPELRRRDLDMAGGGHILPFLLPRSLFAEHPDYFRMDAAGRRDAEGNFCVSSQAALEIISANAVKLVRARPHLAVLHVWGHDVDSGSWCACPDCRQFTAQDQYVIACNAIVAGLRNSGFTIRVSPVAYHDTLVPDLTVQPDPELELSFALRNRCYAHAIDEPQCERNLWHRKNVLRWQSRIPANRLTATEYYADPILFRSLGITFPTVVVADLAAAQELGAERTYMLVICPVYSYAAHVLNMVAYARRSWDGQLTADAIVDEFCHSAYGPATSALSDYWTLMERATGRLVTNGPWPELSDDEPMRALIECVEGAPPELERAGRLLQEALALALTEPERRRVLREQAVWEFTWLQAKALVEHLRAAYHLARAEFRHLQNRTPNEPGETNYLEDLFGQRIVKDRPAPSTPGGYVEAIEHLTRAIDLHEQSRQSLTGSAGKLMNPSWLSSPIGFSYQEDKRVRDLRALKLLAAEHLSEYASLSGPQGSAATSGEG